MEYSRFLDCLAADFARLRAVVPTNLSAAVPSCPGWTVADLTHHVGQVYLHKTMAMREGAEPNPWPPKELADEEPLALLDRAYASLLDEFAVRQPEDPAGTWYTPDQTVGFWIRRMAQETVIHRIDAELGTGALVAPVRATSPSTVSTSCSRCSRRTASRTGPGISPTSWATRRAEHTRFARMARRGGCGLARGLFAVDDGLGEDPTDVSVSGPPTAVLRWIWNRESADEPSDVTVEGADDAVAELRRCIVTATQ